MRISDWSSDVCSSDLAGPWQLSLLVLSKVFSCKKPTPAPCLSQEKTLERFHACPSRHSSGKAQPPHPDRQPEAGRSAGCRQPCPPPRRFRHGRAPAPLRSRGRGPGHRSEEHTSELQSLMRISYAVFCLKKKNNTNRD